MRISNVLAATHACHDALRAHERVHVAQAEHWGPLFFVAYAASSAWQLFSGGRPTSTTTSSARPAARLNTARRCSAGEVI